MKNFIILIISLAFTVSASGQSQLQSKPILDKASAVNNGFKTISTDFTFTSIDLQSVNTITEKGKIQMKAEKYRLKLTNSEIIFDGKSVYHYIPASNEVNITNPEPAKVEKGDFFISNPRDVFSFYTKNFKNKWIAEVLVNGKACHEIDLYPNDLKTKYTRITMHIDKGSYQIVDIKLIFKNGERQSVEFSNFKPNTAIADSEFTFDQSKYPGIIVNDMRF